MRYYDLTLQQPGASKPLAHWTSYPNGPTGKPDPNALDIEFDIPVVGEAVPAGNHTLRIWGVPLQLLSDAYQFTGAGAPGDAPEMPMNIVLKAGMGGGLPLENPKQIGVIAKGSVFQSFGNWVGTDMTLDLVINPTVYTFENPGNFMLNWRKGMELSDVLKQCLETAYNGKNIPVTVNIANNIVANRDQLHFSATLEGLAQMVHDHTYDATNGPVSLVAQNGGIHALDASHNPKKVQLAFTDLIGQPTWIKPFTMQAKLVMRGDLQVGSIIEMPKGYPNAPGFATTTAAAFPSSPVSPRYKPTFTQSFRIIEMDHIGVFRSTDAGEWATIVNAVQMGNSTTSGAQ